MARKHGTEEYYIDGPDRVGLTAYRRSPDEVFEQVPNPDGYVSPRLGVRFDLTGSELVVYRRTAARS